MASTVEIIINAKDNASGVLKGVAGTIGNIAKVAGAAALKGGEALGAFLVSSVKDAMEAENALAQLNAIIQSTGGVAGVTARQVMEYADSASMVTRFTDEAIISGQSMLLTFTSIGKDVFPMATSTMLDMSQALGQDLQSSAIQLGKALNDPVQGITALRRVGVQFTDDQEKLIKKLVESGKLEEAQTLILKELQTEFGGSAEAAGETFAGRLDILNNRMSNLKENIGNALMPALFSLSDIFTDIMANPAVLQFIDDFSSGIATLADRLLSLFTSGKAFDLSFVTAMFSNWADSVDWATLSTDLANGIKSIDWAAVGLEIRTAFLNIMNGLHTIISEVDWKALSDALGTALEGVIAGLFGYVSFEQLKTDFNNGFVYIGLTIQTTIESWKLALITKLNEIKRIISDTIATWKLAISQKLTEIVTLFVNKGKEFVKGIADGIKNGSNKVIDAVKAIIDKILSMIPTITIPIGTGGGSTGGGSSNSPKPPGYASGGVATGSGSGHWELLHGTEGIFTRDQMAMLAPVGAGGGVTINLTYAPAVSLASEAELQKHLMPVILRGVREARRY